LGLRAICVRVNRGGANTRYPGLWEKTPLGFVNVICNDYI